MTFVDKYSEKTLVGSSDTTEVFRARNIELGRIEAIKVLRESHRNNHAMRNRFLQSNSTWAGFGHSNLVKIVNVFREETAVITDYFETSLAKMIAQGAADQATVAKFLRDCLSGIDFLHGNGFLYLNVKPTNVFLDQQNTFKIADGQCFRIGSAEHLTAPGGTWKYLSPELLDEDSPLGTGSDIYGLGFLALELLVGPQFDQHFGGTSNVNFDSNMAWHNWHCSRSQENPMAQELCGHVSEPFARLIDGMTRKNISNRYCRAPDVLHVLDEIERDGQSAGGLGRPQPGTLARTDASNGAGENGIGPANLQEPAGETLVCELTILSGPQMGQVIPVNNRQFGVGGVEGALVHLDPLIYPGCVNRTLQMEMRDSGWAVSSDEPFFVNCQLVGKSVELRSGDVLRFGASGPDIQFVRKGPKSFSVTKYLSAVKTTSATSAASSAPLRPGSDSSSENGSQSFAPTGPAGSAAVSPGFSSASAPPKPVAPTGPATPVAAAAPLRPAAPTLPDPVATPNNYLGGVGQDPTNEEIPATRTGFLGRMFGSKSKGTETPEYQGPQPGYSVASKPAVTAETGGGLTSNQKNWIAGIGTGLVGLIAFILVPVGVPPDTPADDNNQAVVKPDENLQSGNDQGEDRSDRDNQATGSPEEESDRDDKNRRDN